MNVKYVRKRKQRIGTYTETYEVRQVEMNVFLESDKNKFEEKLNLINESKEVIVDYYLMNNIVKFYIKHNDNIVIENFWLEGNNVENFKQHLACREILLPRKLEVPVLIRVTHYGEDL